MSNLDPPLPPPEVKEEQKTEPTEEVAVELPGTAPARVDASEA